MWKPSLKRTLKQRNAGGCLQHRIRRWWQWLLHLGIVCDRCLPLTLFAPFSLGFLTSFVFSGISGSHHFDASIAYGIIRHFWNSRKIKEGQLTFLDLYCFCGRSRILARWISTWVSITVNRFCFRFTSKTSSCDKWIPITIWNLFKNCRLSNSKSQ